MYVFHLVDDDLEAKSYQDNYLSFLVDLYIISLSNVLLKQYIQKDAVIVVAQEYWHL